MIKSITTASHENVFPGLKRLFGDQALMTHWLDLKSSHIKMLQPEPVRVTKGDQVLRDPSEEDYHERRQKPVSQEVQHFPPPGKH